MKTFTITEADINRFKSHLLIEEKSEATIDKYVRDTRAFLSYTNYQPFDKKTVVEYKEWLSTTYKIIFIMIFAITRLTP